MSKLVVSQFVSLDGVRLAGTQPVGPDGVIVMTYVPA